MLEAEAQKTPMMLPEDIKREKGGGVNVIKHDILFIELAPEELPLSGEGYTIMWIY